LNKAELYKSAKQDQVSNIEAVVSKDEHNSNILFEKPYKES